MASKIRVSLLPWQRKIVWLMGTDISRKRNVAMSRTYEGQMSSSEIWDQQYAQRNIDLRLQGSDTRPRTTGIAG